MVANGRCVVSHGWLYLNSNLRQLQLAIGNS
jgi:hypothetical protein